MQVVIAVAAREQQMIRILDDERVVRAGDEFDEISSLSRARLSAVYRTRALSALRADRALRIARTSRVSV